jgi:hypothetical protein
MIFFIANIPATMTGLFCGLGCSGVSSTLPTRISKHQVKAPQALSSQTL